MKKGWRETTGFLAVLIIVSVLVSCKTQKEATEETVMGLNFRELASNVNIADYILNNTILTWGRDSVGTKTRIHVKVYDTSAPKDSVTGQYPLVQDMDIEQDRTEVSESGSIDQSNEEKRDSTSHRSEVELNDSLTSKVRTLRKGGADNVFCLELCLAIAFGVALVAAGFVYYLKRR